MLDTCQLFKLSIAPVNFCSPSISSILSFKKTLFSSKNSTFFTTEFLTPSPELLSPKFLTKILNRFSQNGKHRFLKSGKIVPVFKHYLFKFCTTPLYSTIRITNQHLYFEHHPTTYTKFLLLTKLYYFFSADYIS